jgi:hypothetical protein
VKIKAAPDMLCFGAIDDKTWNTSVTIWTNTSHFYAKILTNCRATGRMIFYKRFPEENCANTCTDSRNLILYFKELRNLVLKV